MQITNFNVSFTRKMTPAQYESAEASVTLVGVLEDGEDVQTALYEAMAKAKSNVLVTLGLKCDAALDALVGGSVEKKVSTTKGDAQKKTRKKADSVEQKVDNVVPPMVDEDAPTLADFDAIGGDVEESTDEEPITAEELHAFIQQLVVDRKISFPAVKKMMVKYNNAVRISDVPANDRNKLRSDVLAAINS